MKKIFIVDDDMALLTGLKDAFEAEGYKVDTASEGESAVKKAIKNEFDCMILDLNLPLKSGLEVCKELRASRSPIPIIMLTSKNEEIDKVVGLEVGADDYVTKPFSLKELIARVKAVLRRTQNVSEEIEEVKFGNIVLNFKKLEGLRKKTKLDLSITEFKILKYLIQHEGEAISRDKFLDEVWGYDSYPTTRTIDNYMLALRKKIEDDPANPKHIVTLHTLGYKFLK